jgi:CRISPR-associated protein Cmr3
VNIVIHSNEPLVFRDGRPFGDSGHVNGGMLRWPWPSTLVGMLRSRIALSRDPDYFQAENGEKADADKLAALKAITAERTLPIWQQAGTRTWQYLFPAPADALVLPGQSENSYQVSGFKYVNPFDQGGIDLPWKNWLLPIAESMEKPAGDSPRFWYQSTYFDWLKNGSVQKEISAKELGLSLPQPEIRMHTAIDSQTGTVKTGQLFASQGIRLTTADNDRQKGGRFGFGIELRNTADSDDPLGACHLGGERKTAFAAPLKEKFPVCPDWFDNSRYLRLILLSPGDFGSWAPSWLLPDKAAEETDWKTVPGSDIALRLCSAFIPPWQPVSGWDYETRSPKATRKLVPPGAVYVVELKDSAQAQNLAEMLWGRSMADNLSDPDGCGIVCVGKAAV